MSGRIGVLLVAGIAACGAGRPVPHFTGGVEVPLTVTDRGTLLVPVALGETVVRPFVLDTAASITVSAIGVGTVRHPAIILGADLFAGRSVAIAFADRAIFISR
jgi:hypothetical protein